MSAGRHATALERACRDARIPRTTSFRSIVMGLSTLPTLQAGYTGYPSSQDASINWDRPADVGRIEARYVRRCPDYFVVYLSSQTGCNQGCRMCHLTATGQTQLRDVTHAEFIDQAETVLDYYRNSAPPARTVH